MISSYQVSGNSGHLFINGVVNQSLKFGADGFFKALLTLPSYRCLDLLRIAASIYAVDRIAKRKKRRDNEGGIRQLALNFEVYDLAFWARPDIKRLLLEILTLLTDDDWFFEFTQLRRNPGDLGHQNFLDLPRPFRPRAVALYSGGLDSAAGLANRVLDGGGDYLLVTVGHQSGMHRRVKRQLTQLRSLLKVQQELPINLLHSTLTTSLEGGKARRMREQERTQRSRAFLFCSCAVIAAKAYDLEVIEVFENGVGAINLPLMSGMLGGGLSTRGSHPTFLRLMSELSNKVTERPMRFVLPFRDKTKAEMLQPLRSVTGMAKWLQESRSCVHTAIRQKGKTHCGHCPACIERRQAFLCAGIEERLNDYQTDVLTEFPVDQDDADYLYLYKSEAINWLQGNEHTRQRMTNHLRLTDVPNVDDGEIEKSQFRHSQEVLRTFGPLESMSDKLKPSSRDKQFLAENEVMP